MQNKDLQQLKNLLEEFQQSGFGNVQSAINKVEEVQAEAHWELAELIRQEQYA